MSINTNDTGLPDVGALEKLANELFSALPGDFSTHGISPQRLSSLSTERNGFNSTEPQTSLPDPHFANPNPALPSFGGLGISPFGLPKASGLNIDQPQSNVPNVLGATHISPTLGGIEKPSGLEGIHSVGAINPQTSLPEPNSLGIGKVPNSLSGSGISPSVVQKEYSNPSKEHLPFANENPFALDLGGVFGNISSFNSAPQLPTTGASDASFYFLSGKEQPIRALDKTSQFENKSVSANNGGGLITAPFDVNLIKKDFPILSERVNGRPLIWLDNAATTQKPKLVIDRISYFYEHENSNIHRAAHELAARATDAYESAREKVRVFLGAKSTNEIVFVRGATEAINLVAKSWGEQNLVAGDEIVVSNLEHHANIVPWQQLAAKKGLKLRVIPVDDDGQILLDEYAKLLNSKTKLVSFTQVSNALGTVTPAKTMVAMAHAVGAKVLVDGAQSVSHMRVNVVELDADWFVFSGHKVFGPTGIGVVYGKEELLNQTEPWQGGGNMIVDVTFEHTTFHKAPGRFEAGTGNIADAVGLGAAIDYVTRIGMDVIHQYEHYLLVYATKLLKEIPGLRLIGTAKEKASVLSFVFDGFKTEEVGAALNAEGIAVRSGHHCAQPILRRFGLEATVRPSLAFYNTCSDIDVLVETLYKLRSGKK